MSARSEKPKKRRIRLVGGGFRWSRAANVRRPGGSAKSMRRALRRRAKDKVLSVTERRALKQQIRELLLAKNQRANS